MVCRVKIPIRVVSRLRLLKIEDASEKLQATAQSRKARFDQEHKLTKLGPGSHVFVRRHDWSSTADGYNAKLYYQVDGPFIVLKEYGENVYSLYDPSTEMTMRKNFREIFLD